MKKIILFFYCLMPLSLLAQDDFTLRFLDQLPQANWVNASSQPQNKISISLPVMSSFNGEIYNTGFTYHDVIGHNADTAVIRLGHLAQRLKKSNYLGFGVNTNLFAFNYCGKKFMLGFSIQDKMRFQFTYPGDLFKLLWEGNGAHIGETMEIGGFGINATYYHEIALHYNMPYKKWMFGASPKLYLGQANISTKQSGIQLYTDPSYYQLTLTSAFDIRTSGLPPFDNSSNTNYSWQDAVLGTKNMGLGLDAAARYTYNSHLNLSAGIKDLGYIKWKNRVQNFVSGPTELKFDGVHLEDLFLGDSLSAKHITDSITNLFQLQKNYEPYTTSMPFQFFVGATYDFYKHHRAAALLNAYGFNKKILPSLTLLYRCTYTRHFSGALSYTIKPGSYTNFGLAITTQLAGIQGYFGTDNLLAYFRPLDARSTNLHMGFNIVFGDPHAVKKPKDIAK